MKRTMILCAALCVAGCRAVPTTAPVTDPDTGKVTEEPTGEVTYVADADAAGEVATLVAPFLPPPFNILVPGLAALAAGVRAQRKEGAA